MTDEARPAARRTFTYDEAVALLPEVRRLTEDAHRQVDALRASGDASAETQSRADEILTAWARALLEQGIEVKGLWLVDFDNGSGYYCWKYPEPALSYFHGYEEGFTGRMRIV